MIRIFLFLFLTFSVTLSNSELMSQVQTSIIAKVENRIISSYDLKNKVKLILFLSKQELTQSNINSAKQPALRTLIDLKLKEEELSNLNLPIKKDQNVNNYLIQIASQYNTDIIGLEKLFKSYNIDFEKYQREIQIEFAWQKLIFKLYGKKISLNNNEIERELNDFINNQKKIVEYKLAEIEVIVESLSDRDKTISEIQKQIEKIGFENTAIKFSVSPSSLNGGDIGWVSSRSLSSIFFKEVKKINRGQVSNPIFKSNSIIFLKLNDVRDLDIDNLNAQKIKENIIKAKKNEYLNMFSTNHLSKLKNNALIKIK